MESLHNYLPKDLVAIVEEYAKDTTLYDILINQFKLHFGYSYVCAQIKLIANGDGDFRQYVDEHQSMQKEMKYRYFSFIRTFKRAQTHFSGKSNPINVYDYEGIFRLVRR